MRPQLAIGGLAALLALGGAVYVVARSGDDAPEAVQDDDAPRRKAAKGRGGRDRERGAPGDDAAAPDTTLEARVAKLEREVATLRRQAALSAGRRVASAGGDPQAALAEELDSPELDSTVRDIVADERERERSERWERRSQRALQRLADAGGLNDEQQTAIGALWDSERKRITPLFLEARSGERDFDDVIKDVEAIREETDAEAKKVLDDAQLAAYEDNRPRGPGGRGRGGGGGRGGRGGGGGGQPRGG